MAHKNQQMDLKRKSSYDALGNDLQNKKAIFTESGQSLGSSGAFSLIESFLMEEKSKGELEIIDDYFRPNWWYRDPLLLQFLDVIHKIMSVNSTNPLQEVLPEIVALGLDILGIANPPENVYDTIVTNALQLKDTVSHPDDASGVVIVDPKPIKGVASTLIDNSVKKVVGLLYPNLDPSPFIVGDFAPIREETLPTSQLITKGDIPVTLNGMMIRNGPNPQFDPVAMYSWMDGDSMLHGIRFKEGKATYVSRYVQTSRFKQENFFQSSEFLQYGDLDGQFGLLMSCVQLLKAKLGLIDASYGWLNADTGVVFHNGMLMALQDFDKPYVVNVTQNGDLETRGINDYRKGLTHNFLPHPKQDPQTGELFIAGVSYTPPYAIYNVVTKEGVMSKPVSITVSGPSYMHDLGITHNYVIFMDLPYCYDPEHMVKHEDWVYMFDILKKPRFGILPRYAQTEDNIKWFEFDVPFFIFHNGNSWEEDEDNIVLFSCLMKPDINVPKYVQNSSSTRSVSSNEVPKQTKTFFRPSHTYNGPKIRRKANEIDLESVEITLPSLYKLTFNMKTGESKHEELSEIFCEYPKINESYMGRKSRYMYTSELNTDSKIISTVKNDLYWNTQIKLELGQTMYGSEVVFVPNRYFNTSNAGEDDGYLTTFVHDEKESISYAYVIDARKMEVSARVTLPNRVPYGFHATFVTEEELQAQKLIT